MGGTGLVQPPPNPRPPRLKVSPWRVGQGSGKSRRPFLVSQSFPEPGTRLLLLFRCSCFLCLTARLLVGTLEGVVPCNTLKVSVVAELVAVAT